MDIYVKAGTPYNHSKLLEGVHVRFNKLPIFC